MEPKETVEFIKKSFSPYNCSISIPDYGETLNLKVRDKSGKEILSVKNISTDIALNKLQIIIEQHKDDIKQKGYSFD